MDWFLDGNGLRHERVKLILGSLTTVIKNDYLKSLKVQNRAKRIN